MRVEVEADWVYVDTKQVKGWRIEIAGYTAVIEEVSTADWKNGDYSKVYQFTVLQDHLRVVEVGQRPRLDTAKVAAEVIIQDDLAARTGL